MTIINFFISLLYGSECIYSYYKSIGLVGGWGGVLGGIGGGEPKAKSVCFLYISFRVLEMR